MFIKKIFKRSSCLIVLSLLATSYTHAESALRVQCIGDAADATVFINGKSHGNCPADIFVKAGLVKLYVVKTVDADHERVFEKTLNLTDNTAKKIKVTLSSSRLTEKAAYDLAQKALEKARNGDVTSMRKVSELYEKGLGVPKNIEKSQYWSQKSVDTKDENTAKAILKRAKAGDIDAMNQMENLYSIGKGVNKSQVQAQNWKNKRLQIIADKEKEQATHLLTRAVAGDLTAMYDMSKLYKSGKGVEQSDVKAKEWENKHALALKENIEKRKNQDRINELETELASYKSGGAYFKNLNNQGLRIARENRGKDDISSVTTVGPTFVVATLVGLSSDLTLAPFRLTDQIQLQKELNARAAKWAKPNSMVAKAVEQQTQK
ncbi:tetratricopeptide repeat protein [Marinomonas sp. TI.3.20]|uniref:tetratricopeptide repeat protein n=1 Tax=Marinomonas sp. TI.3.20 TaxID=3121296 RepID=UPI00311DD1B7